MAIFRFGLALLLITLINTPALAKNLSLREALTQTLNQNPTLLQFPYQLRVAEATRMQAALRPNPSLDIEFENLLGSGSQEGLSHLETTLAFSQVIELGGKLDSRIAVADAERELIEAEFNYAKIEILAETTTRFYRLLLLQELEKHQQIYLSRLQDTYQLAQQRFNLGGAPRGESMRVELAIATNQAKLEELGNQLVQARYELTSMWAESPEFNRVLGNFASDIAIPTRAKLESAVMRAPELLKLFDSERLLTAKLEALKAAAVADVRIGAGVRHNAANDDFGFVLNASIPFQLSNPQRGNIAQNRAEQNLVLAQQKMLREQLKSRANALLANVQVQTQMLTDLTEQLVPRAKTLVETIRNGYSDGIYSVLQILDAQEQLAELEKQQIQRQYATYQDLLQLERMTGQSFMEATL
ncbi:outer membrane protein, cobalt-zinc-cadmium efflux system [Pseudidiomarina maritima]|uniref:Outer membrane protein, cobalt-zinc-cadmium efflux system n=1 Tax=Pseudidiomarina maritima TaxID=519453 RepID=A0A1I6GM45_9GAMM|nr:TolC family protein [Pseudidiomarina maritima]SFR43209.1 outer membrane protein, cobalt-zinc-cadmium efflux system [Pseudidiomarina maritima]